jgi:uncharacterized RDD family membrane protein YckC
MTAEPSAEPGVAEPGQRLVAAIVDTLVVGIPVVSLASWLSGSSTSAATSIAFAAAFLVYESVQLLFWGRTLGKRFARIRVVSAADGGPLTLQQAVVRAAIYAVPIAGHAIGVLEIVAGLFWLVEVGLVFERPLRQALHDRAAGTLVVRE